MAASTIVVLGSEEDEHAATMLAYLRQTGHDAELLDSRWFPTQLTLWRNPMVGEGEMGLPSGRRLSLAQIRSVYWRTYNGVSVPPLGDDEETYIAHNDARSLFEALLIDLPTRWVNGWEAYQLHQTKPVALARVAALGVPIPPTVWSNEPAQVRAFARQHKQVIFKPVQGGDETRRLTEAHLSDENLASLQLAPVTLQAEVAGTNIRVFVAGQRVLACEVRTPELDYRQDLAAELLVHVLPAEIEEQARRIAACLALVWTGIDYRRTVEGVYVFLEANPSPMFLGFEAQTGLPLTASLASLLTAER